MLRAVGKGLGWWDGEIVNLGSALSIYPNTCPGPGLAVVYPEHYHCWGWEFEGRLEMVTIGNIVDTLHRSTSSFNNVYSVCVHSLFFCQCQPSYV